MRRIALTLGLSTLIACGDGTGPVPPTALEVATAAEAVAGRIANDATLTSLLVLSSHFAFFQAPAPVAGTAAAGPVPAGVLGTTYVWDAGLTGYRPDAALAGAPADGVRFRLYASNLANSTPIVPLADIGHVDLANRTAAAGEAFHVRLLAGTRLVTDYMMTVAATPASINANGTGTFTDDVGSVTFELEQRVTGLTYTFDYVLTSDSGLSVDLALTAGSMINMSYTVRGGGTVLELLGNVTASSVDVNIRLNGTLVAHAGGDPSAPVFTASGGGQLMPEQVEAFSLAFAQMLALPFAIDGFFGPAYKFY